MLIARVRVGTSVQQELGNISVALRRSEVQERSARRIVSVYVCTSAEQKLDDVGVAL